MQKKLIGTQSGYVTCENVDLFINSLVAVVSIIGGHDPELMESALRQLEVYHQNDNTVDMRIIRELLEKIKRAPVASFEDVH